jgi:hypothetical protein
MKSNKFLSFAFIAALVVTAVGCTTLRGDDQYLENGTRNSRVYVDDPYMYNNTPMWIRDPYTGRYYQVMPYGYSPYGNSRYNNRYYDSRYDNRRPVYRQQPTQTQQQDRQRANESRSRILKKDN